MLTLASKANSGSLLFSGVLSCVEPTLNVHRAPLKADAQRTFISDSKYPSDETARRSDIKLLEVRLFLPSVSVSVSLSHCPLSLYISRLAASQSSVRSNLGYEFPAIDRESSEFRPDLAGVEFGKLLL